MKSTDWKHISELIGMLAIVASLIFLAFQIRQEEDIGLSEIRFADEANAIEVRAAINEHIDVWIKGGAGSELSEKEQVIFNHLVASVNDRAYTVAGYYRIMNVTARETVIAEFAGLLKHNPGAYEAWKRREQDLQFHRSLIDPNNSEASEWMAEVDSAIEAISKAKRKPDSSADEH